MLKYQVMARAVCISRREVTCNKCADKRMLYTACSYSTGLHWDFCSAWASVTSNMNTRQQTSALGTALEDKPELEESSGQSCMDQ